MSDRQFRLHVSGNQRSVEHFKAEFGFFRDGELMGLEGHILVITGDLVFHDLHPSGQRVFQSDDLHSRFSHHRAQFDLTL
jgi:hypothetical protein